MTILFDWFNSILDTVNSRDSKYKTARRKIFDGSMDADGNNLQLSRAHAFQMKI